MLQGRTCSCYCGEVLDQVVLGAHSHQLHGGSRDTKGEAMVPGRTCSRCCGEVSDEVVLGAHPHQLQGGQG